MKYIDMHNRICPHLTAETAPKGCQHRSEWTAITTVHLPVSENWLLLLSVPDCPVLLCPAAEPAECVHAAVQHQQASVHYSA